MSGPLGNIPGMTYDDVRNRYFPTPPAPPVRATRTEGSRRQRVESLDGTIRPQSRRRAPTGAGPTNGTDSTVEHKPERVRVDRSRTATTINSSGRLPPSHGWKLGDVGAHKSFLRSGRLLGMEQNMIIGDTTLNSSATILAALPNEPTHIMTGNEAGELVGIADQPLTPREVVQIWPDALKRIQGNSRQLGSKIAVRRYQWRTFNLSSPITGLSCHKDFFVATCFGPRPALLICPEYPPFFSNTQRYLEQSARPTVHHNLTTLKDAWCMDSIGDGVVIGGDGKFAYASNLDRPDAKFRTTSIEGKSAVFAVKHINQNEAYIGLRSGGVLHCDVRLPNFLTTVCAADMDTMPVINLVGLENSFGCGRGLLVGRMGSEMSLFDLRFSRCGRSEPAVQYEGHVNDTFRQRLGMAVDASETIVLAAGTDNRVRGWDLYTGNPIHTQTAGPESILGKTFDKAVASILCQEDGSVYAASGSTVNVFGAVALKEQ